MLRSNRERGGLPTPVIAVIVAAIAIGVALAFVAGGDHPGAATVKGKAGFKRLDSTIVSQPKISEQRVNIPKKTPQAEEILKGELIKFYDANGSVRFKTRDPVEGVDSAGRKLIFQPILTIGPKIGKAEETTKSMSRKGAAPPTVKFRRYKGSVKANPAVNVVGSEEK